MRRLAITRNLALMLGLVFASATAAAQSPEFQSPETKQHPFVLIMIDKDSEDKLGFPLDRAIVANAVEKLADAKVKAVVLKFFYNRPQTEAGDAVLAKALKRTKVLLQAGIDNSESNPNALPARFLFDTGTLKGIVGGDAAWIPLPALLANAHDVGFVDVATPTKVPALARYQTRNAKTLWIAALQVALDDAPFVIKPGVEFSIGKKRIALDAESQLAVNLAGADKIEYLKFLDLMEGRIPAAALKDKVVVIGYDGKRGQSLITPFGRLPAHRIFWLGLIDGWRQLQGAQ